MKRYGVVFGAGSYDCNVTWYDTLEEAIQETSLYSENRIDIVYRINVSKTYYNPITGESVTIEKED